LLTPPLLTPLLSAQAAQLVFGALGILPVLGRLAHDHAMGRSLGAALQFAEHDRAAHEATHKPTGVTHLLPAGHAGTHAVQGNVRLGLGRAVPVEFAQEAARLHIQIHVHRLHPRHAFEHVQLWADEHGLVGVVDA
jgi:hypothetical protein